MSQTLQQQTGFITWLPAIAGLCCLGLGAGLIGIYGFFTPHVAKEFGVGVAVVNVGAILLVLVPGMAGPFVGKMVDRFPVRRILLAGSTIAMSGLILTSMAPAPWLAGVAFVFFALGLSMYGPVVINAMLVKRFPGREARALAIAALGISFATIFMPLITGGLLQHYDWREALAFLAGGILVLLLIIISIGVPSEPAAKLSNANASNTYNPWKNPTFWLIGLCVAMGLCAAIVIAICYPPHFIARGFTTSQAAFFVSLSGGAGIVGKTSVALLADRYRHHAKWLAAGLLALLASGLLMLVQMDTATGILPVMLILGFASGAFLPMHAYLNSCYFEASIMGSITGSQMPMFLPFGIAGPVLAGFIYDTYGDYQMAFYGLSLLLISAAGLAALLPREVRLTNH